MVKIAFGVWNHFQSGWKIVFGVHIQLAGIPFPSRRYCTIGEKTDDTRIYLKPNNKVNSLCSSSSFFDLNKVEPMQYVQNDAVGLF